MKGKNLPPPLYYPHFVPFAVPQVKIKSLILSAGYAVMSACYKDISPDPESDEKTPGFQQHDFAYTGVFELWGKTGLPAVKYPDAYDTSAIGRYLGYFRRTEEHGMTGFDWWQLLKFADADADSRSGK